MSSNANSTIQIISLDGNIGSGKSTLMKQLIENKEIFEKKCSDTEFSFLLEPVDEWSDVCDEKGVPILEKFYEDTQKYAFSFQMTVYLSRLSLIKKTVDNFRKNGTKQKLVIITERSLFTDKEVFCKMLYDNKHISKLDYNVYNKWYNTFSCDYNVNKILYLTTSPVICTQRVIKRSRDGEKNISSEYLWLCDEYHKGMIYTFLSEKGEKNVFKMNDNVVSESLLESIIDFVLV
jgi:deoxyadenosine/deoxycytidine kinase